MTEPIPFLDLQAQNGPLLPDIHRAIERVVSNQRFILGPEVEAFEREVATYLGVPHAIGVSSGTDALVVALMALGVGPGDEVLTTPFSFFATAGAISRLGATPVFADIDPDTFNLDPQRVRLGITARTRALLPVHLFGQACDMDALIEVAEEHGLPIVEDAAQAIGARWRDRAVGAWGALGCFSFFPSKNLGAFGDGGLVTARSDALAEAVRVRRVHGAKPKYVHHCIGGNFRLDALQAAILRVKLPHLDRWTEQRRVNAAVYDRCFEEARLTDVQLRSPVRAAESHVYNQYVIRTDRRDALAHHLRQQGIPTQVYYPRPLHLQHCYAELGLGEGSFPRAERAAREVLALPIFAELGESRVRRVAEEIIAFLKS